MWSRVRRLRTIYWIAMSVGVVVALVPASRGAGETVKWAVVISAGVAFAASAAELLTIRCPHCFKPMFWPSWTHASIFSSSCVHCSHDLQTHASAALRANRQT